MIRATTTTSEAQAAAATPGPASGESGRWTHAGWDDRRSDRWGATQWQWPQYKGDFSDPPAWPGWSYRRQWVAAVRRWDKMSDLPVDPRAEKLLRTLGWELQVEFEHLSETTLAGAGYLDAILGVMEMRAAVREDEEKREAFRGVMQECNRKRNESLAQFAARRQRDYSRAASFGIVLPPEFRAQLMREGAGLTEQGQQNLTALLQGKDTDVDFLAATLARMDVRSDRLSGYVEKPVEEKTFATCEGDPEDDEDEESEPSEDVGGQRVGPE